MIVESVLKVSVRWLYVLLFLLSPPVWAGTSALWGKSGEKWDPRGRLPDFSFAGYHAGLKVIPSPKVTTNVKTYGAKGDGKTDDSAAIQKAIDATPAKGVLFFPKGRYLITRVLYIRKSNIVLRGAGSGSKDTVLYLTKNLTQARGPNVSWKYGVGGFLHVEPKRSSTNTLGTVTVNTKRGDTTLTMNKALKLKPGEWVELRLTGDKTSSFWKHLHNNQQTRNTCDSYNRVVTLEWPARVAQVRGKLVTLNQPLRHDVLTTWSPTLRKRVMLEEVGIENLRLEFIHTKYPGHLKELGYNGIFFKYVLNSWVRNVAIVHSDNGITATRSKGIEVRKLRLEGRYGHHGVSFTRAYDCLLTEFDFQSDWRHSMTVDHVASGNVTSNGKAKHSFSMDHHRDIPFENLFSNIQSKCTYASGGNSCAGPHSAARGTFWNLFGSMSGPAWGYIQTNLIGKLSVSTKKTTTREWYENVSALTPKDLHLAQLQRRKSYKAPTRFGSSTSTGDRRFYEERDPARWQVFQDSGDWVYRMRAHGIAIPTGSRLGETTIFKSRSYRDVRIQTKARVETFASTRDIALILGYQDDENYLMALFHAGTTTSGGKTVPNSSINLVKNGKRTVLTRSSRVPFSDSYFHNFAFVRKGKSLQMFIDGQLIATTSSSDFATGRVGVGTWNDKVLFTDIQISVPTTTEPTTEPTAEPATEPLKEPLSEPVTEPLTEPLSEPLTEPVTDAGSEPSLEPASEPVSEPTPEPRVEPSHETASEPLSEPSIPDEMVQKDASEPQNGEPRPPEQTTKDSSIASDAPAKTDSSKPLSGCQCQTPLEGVPFGAMLVLGLLGWIRRKGKEG
jgi:hypothetical protein